MKGEPMAENGKSSFGWFKIFVLFILIPLTLTVVGGLVVEWLKPSFIAPVAPVTPGAGPISTITPAVTPQDTAAFRKANTLKMLSDCSKRGGFRTMMYESKTLSQ